MREYITERLSPELKRVFVGSGTTFNVEPYHHVLFLANAGASSTSLKSTAVLPNVSECQGNSFFFQALSASTGPDKIKYMDGTAATKSTTIGTADITLEFFSNGREWALRRGAI